MIVFTFGTIFGVALKTLVRKRRLKKAIQKRSAIHNQLREVAEALYSVARIFRIANTPLRLDIKKREGQDDHSYFISRLDGTAHYKATRAPGVPQVTIAELFMSLHGEGRVRHSLRGSRVIFVNGRFYDLEEEGEPFRSNANLKELMASPAAFATNEELEELVSQLLTARPAQKTDEL